MPPRDATPKNMDAFYEYIQDMYELSREQEDMIALVDDDEFSDDQNIYSAEEVRDEQQEKPDISSEPDESKYGHNPFNIIADLKSFMERRKMEYFINKHGNLGVYAQLETGTRYTLYINWKSGMLCRYYEASGKCFKRYFQTWNAKEDISVEDIRRIRPAGNEELFNEKENNNK